MTTKSVEVQRDMAYGQLTLIVTTPDADMKENKDYFIGSLGIAYRRRRLSLNTFHELSIRDTRKSGAKTEKEKMLSGECGARVYIQEFKDYCVISLVEDIIDCLRKNLYKVVLNNDGKTKAAYISLNNLPHLLIAKEI